MAIARSGWALPGCLGNGPQPHFRPATVPQPRSDRAIRHWTARVPCLLVGWATWQASRLAPPRASILPDCRNLVQTAPTPRIGLITSRNHHVSGFGIVAETAKGFRFTTRSSGRKTAPQHGFFQASIAKPVDQWPTGMGFDYFYGFVGGDASQRQPNLFGDTTATYPSQGTSPGARGGPISCRPGCRQRPRFPP